MLLDLGRKWHEFLVQGLALPQYLETSFPLKETDSEPQFEHRPQK